MNFIKKVAVVALFVIILLVLKSTFSVLLMILAAAIIALYFHGFKNLISRTLKLSDKWSMLISIAGTFLIPVALFWFIGAKVQSQVNALSERFPSMVS